jgi:Protein of unknown function (DUF1275)
MMVSETNEVGYGTIDEPPESNPSPLTLKPNIQESFGKRLKARMVSDIESQKTHLVLIGLFFVTGMVDSAAYNIWSCFVSMQTGVYHHAMATTRTSARSNTTQRCMCVLVDNH